MPKHNNILIMALIIVLILQMVIAAPLFAEDQKTGAQEPQITLERAIQIVRENFEIPDTLSEFSSAFSSYSNRMYWSLNWNSTGEKYENISAQVDAVNGEILSLHVSKAFDRNASYELPALTVAEAKAIAESTVKKLTSQKYESLRFVAGDNIMPLTLYGMPTYNFSWERAENGITVQGNGASIQIDANTGSVISYNFTWHAVNLPKAEQTISADQAAQALSQSKLLELQYFLAPVYRPLSADNKEQVQLIYRLNKNGLIDALTGSPLQLKPNQYLGGGSHYVGGMGNLAKESAMADSRALTPQERREVERNTQLLSKEEAIRIIQKWVEIPSGFTLRTMNLNTDSGLREAKIWYFEWVNSGQENYRSITARVNAANGELLGFNLNTPRLPVAENAAPAPISKQDAQALVEEFLQKIQPEKFSQTKLKAGLALEVMPVDADVSDKIALPQPEEAFVSFNYERVVNGLTFAANGISVTVDLTTKKITSYYLNWFNLDFPPTTQALEQAKAEATFLAARPMVLNYVLISTDGVVNEAKLVYLPASNTDRAVSDIIDAKTGQFLNSMGQPLNAKARSYQFTDIAGLDAEKEIKALGQAGILGEYGTIFKPAEDISAESLLRALLQVNNGSGDYVVPAEDILKIVKDQGWLTEDISLAQPVSRELFSKILVRYLGLTKIAELNTIYKLPFNDAGSSEGYIALTTGLNLIKAGGENFEPGKNVTRAEAAFALVKTLGQMR